MRLKLKCSVSTSIAVKGDLRMDKTYQDITITNWKTKKEYRVMMVKILSIELDDECMIISYEEDDILHVLTFPKKSYEVHIA